MPITTRLTAAGTYFVNGTFDEFSWTPANLGSDLALWLDAADATTITLNGSTVSQWGDKSGNLLHAVQSTASRQPLYTANGLNNLPVITFDGSNNQLNTPSFVMGNTAVTVAFRNAINQPIAELTASAGFRGFWGDAYPSYSTHINYAVNGGALSAAAPNSAVNGTFIVSQTQRNLATSGTLAIGQGFPAYSYLNGFVAEMIIVNSVLTTTDIQNLEGYLAWKWGLQKNLVAGHPYRNTPPIGRNRISNGTVFTAELDEITINPVSAGVSKRELSTGVLQVANEFDEFTGAPIVDNNLRVWVDAAQTASYSGSGSTWNNLSPATGSFTLFNSPTFDGNNAGGELTFLPASFQYADNGTNLGNMSNFTVEAWAKVTASLTGQITSIICNQYNLTSALNFSIGTNNAPTDYNICVGFFDGAWRNTTGFNPTLNQWYHFVGTYNGSVLRYYINGSQNSFLNYSGTPSSGGSIRIARRWDSPDNVSANFFPGEVGVCRIYNRALTADEVLTNFYAHRNRYGV